MSTANSLHAAHAETAHAAMSASIIGGGKFLDVIAAGVKALIGSVSVLGTDGIVAAITLAYDKLTSGDNAWLPGDNADPASLESRVEKLGRDAIAPAVAYILALLVA